MPTTRMLSVDQALQIVLEHAHPLTAVTTPLADACQHVLADSIASDIDSPPHDKSIVDGYAVLTADAAMPGVELKILEEVTAGAVPTQAVVSGAATRIMTGAPIPAGADAVVMVEKTEVSGGRVRILQTDVKPGQNITRRAAAMRRGQAILPPGKLLRPIEIGLLAEVGRREVAVIPRPRAAVLVTGNELVEYESPGPGQIRNSNGPMLAALATPSGAKPTNLGIARDNESDLAASIGRGLKHDLLVISGGVSAGVLDLVPATLEKLGVKQLFHKVNLKPGKPLWFGVKQDDDSKTLVFGLPGNPVSSLVCFELFVRPAIQKMRGLPPKGLHKTTGKLCRDHEQRGDRPAYWPSAICEGEIMPLAWKGSGDLCALTSANCLAIFPPGDKLFPAGEQVEVLLLEQ